MLLTRVAKVFFNLAQSNTNPDIQKLQADLAPKLAQHQDEIALNPKLFARVKALYDARDGVQDAEKKRLVERYYQNFVRAGALLNDADKATLRKLNEEESKLTTDFQTKLLAALGRPTGEIAAGTLTFFMGRGAAAAARCPDAPLLRLGGGFRPAS